MYDERGAWLRSEIITDPGFVAACCHWRDVTMRHATQLGTYMAGSEAWVTTKYLLWTHHVQIDWTSAGFPSDAIVAREAIPAGSNGPFLLCPGPRGG